MKDLAREGFEWIGSDPGRLYVRGIEPRLSKDDEFRENREGRKEEMDCLWMTTTAMAAFI